MSRGEMEDELRASEALRRRAPRMALFVLAAIAGLELLALTGICSAPHDMLRAAALGPFLSSGLFVVFLMLLRSKPERAELGAAAALAVGLALVAGESRGSLSPLSLSVVLGASLGEASALVLASRVARRHGGARRHALQDAALAALLPGFILTTGPDMTLSATLYPATYDGAAYHLDSGLGFEPSFLVGRLFLASDAFQLPCVLAYACLPFLVGALLLLPLRPERAPPRADLLESFLLAGVLGCALYNACPVAGPYYAFTDTFPASLPVNVASTPFVIPASPRDAVPSLHAAWAILAFWHARSRGLVTQVAMGGALVLILLGALGLGEHYVGDFVVAVPFVVGVDALATHGVPLARAERWRPIVAGVGLVVVWITALRTAAGWLGAHSAATWALMLGTLALPLALRAQLQRCTVVSASGICRST